MVKLVTYTDDRMTTSAMNLRDSAYKYGVDQVYIYTPDYLDERFKEQMSHVLQHERGAGFYCWKPYVIHDAIRHMNDGEYLIWSDAGTEIISNVHSLINSMDDDILFFSNGWNHLDWCKMDLIAECFKLFLQPGPAGEDQTNILKECKQVQASHIVFKVSQRSRTVIEHWLHLTKQPGLVDNEPSILPNWPTFQEHRWDQSILCCLQIMYGFRLHWFPTTTADHIRDAHPDDHYPAIFNHHRKRNNEY